MQGVAHMRYFWVHPQDGSLMWCKSLDEYARGGQGLFFHYDMLIHSLGNMSDEI